jgi:prepilin-type processing-associated H-X9-DG protein
MTTEGRCIQAKADCKSFDGARYLFVGKPAVHDFPALGNRSDMTICGMSAFAVAIGGKADVAYCDAHVCL